MKDRDFATITNVDYDFYHFLLRAVQHYYPDIDFQVGTMDFLTLVAYCREKFGSFERIKPQVGHFMDFVAFQNQLNQPLVEVIQEQARGRYTPEQIEKGLYAIFTTHMWIPRELESMYPVIGQPTEALKQQMRTMLEKSSPPKGDCILVQIAADDILSRDRLLSYSTFDDLVAYAFNTYPNQIQRDIPLQLSDPTLQENLQESLRTKRPVYVKMNPEVGLVLFGIAKERITPPDHIVEQNAKVHIARTFVNSFVAHARKAIHFRKAQSKGVRS